MKEKMLLMASKENCPFCTAMKPVFEKVVKEMQGLENLAFGIYDVDTDDWELADELGLEGVPGFAFIETESRKIYEINNEGLIDKSVILAMVINNLHKE